MIGLDTNVLIRHVTQDDPAQSPRASALIEGRLTEEEPGFVSIVTLAETAWVLDRVYKYPHDQIAAAEDGNRQPARDIRDELPVGAAGVGLLRRASVNRDRCGARILGRPAWDPDFNTADLPMMMRIADLPARYRKHFLEK